MNLKSSRQSLITVLRIIINWCIYLDLIKIYLEALYWLNKLILLLGERLLCHFIILFVDN